MNEVSVSLDFQNEFRGNMTTQNTQVSIGREQGDLMPYDLMLGALGSCYYANFIDVTKKMRLMYERVKIDIHGVKRDEIPTTLKEVSMKLTIYGAANEKGFQRASDMSAKYCSVHETITKVGHISIELNFEDGQ